MPWKTNRKEGEPSPSEEGFSAGSGCDMVTLSDDISAGRFGVWTGMFTLSEVGSEGLSWRTGAKGCCKGGTCEPELERPFGFGVATGDCVVWDESSLWEWKSSGGAVRAFALSKPNWGGIAAPPWGRSEVGRSADTAPALDDGGLGSGFNLPVELFLC